MTLLDVHPEHLIDGFLEDRLSESEKTQLDQHLRQCDACRLELSLSNELAIDGVAVAYSSERADEVAVDRALSSMLANQVLRVPALKSLPVQKTFGRKKLAKRAMVGTLLFSLGAAAAIIVMQKEASDQGKAAEPKPVASAGPIPVAAATHATNEPVREPMKKERDSGASGVKSKSEPKVAPQQEEPSTLAPTKAVKPPAETAAGLFRLATVERRAGKSGEAIATYQKLQARFPGSAEALISRLALGRLLAGSSPALAYTQYDTYLRQGGPLRPEALVGRAKALTRMGQTARAKAAWQEVLEASPNSIYAEQARRHLSPSQP